MSRRGLEDRLQVLVEPGVDNTPRKTNQATIAMLFGACACACVHVYACVLGPQLELSWMNCRRCLPPPHNTCHAFWWMWCVCVCVCVCVCMCARAEVGTILDELSQMLAATPKQKQVPCHLVDRDSNKLCRLSPSSSVSPDIVVEQSPGAGTDDGIGAR